MINDRRYFMDSNIDAIWVWDTKTESSFWRTHKTPNINEESSYLLSDYLELDPDNIREITKEKANKICKDWYKEHR